MYQGATERRVGALEASCSALPTWRRAGEGGALQLLGAALSRLNVKW